ncbi:MAG: ASCH domain-containing protein [Pseudomonadota bacterium]
MDDFATQIAALKARYPGAETYRFGDSADLNAELLALVRAGRKTATCSTEIEIAAGEAAPVVGRCDISLEWSGRPALITETLRLERVRFRDMTEAMALAEGENASLADWRAGHERYYRRKGIFDPDMWLLWEAFRVVEDVG